MKWSELKQRWKKACTTDNVIDFSVDVGLIAFDVLSSPILIVVRVVRFYFKKFEDHMKFNYFTSKKLTTDSSIYLIIQ